MEENKNGIIEFVTKNPGAAVAIATIATGGIGAAVWGGIKLGKKMKRAFDTQKAIDKEGKILIDKAENDRMMETLTKLGAQYDALSAAVANKPAEDGAKDDNPKS